MAGFGLGIRPTGRRRGGVLAAVEPLAYTLLSDFETTSGLTKAAATTLTLETGDRKTLNTAAARVQPDGSGLAAGYLNGVPVSGTPVDFSAFSRVAYCVDVGDWETHEGFPNKSNFRIGASVYNLFPPTSTSYSLPSNPTNINARGKVWVSRAMQYYRLTNASGTRLDSLGAVTPTFGIENVDGYAADFVIDALVAPDNAYVPNLVIGFDDLVSTQLSEAVPRMNAAGLLGTFYVPTNNLSIGTNTADLAAAKALGWGLSLDSGPSDEPSSVYASPAAWIAVLQAMQAEMISTFGSSVAEDIKHICYSWGRCGYLPDVSVTYTSAGTTTQNLGGSNGYNATVGQPVFGTGVPAGTTVASVVSSTTITTNNVIPSGSRTIILGGRPASQACTATGTDTITITDTSNLEVGFTVTSAFPESVRGAAIIAIPTGTTVQLDRTVPSTCKRITFGHTAGVWWHTKAQDALLAAGFKSGRNIWSATTDGIFCGYPPEPITLFNWNGTGPSGATVALMMERLDRDIANGTDSEHYWHAITDPTLFQDYVTAVKARVDAGTLTVKPKHVRIAEIEAFAAIA